MIKKLLVVIFVFAALGIGIVFLLKNQESADGVGFSDDGRLRIVCTSMMVTDMVKVVGGERVEVIGLMGPQVDPHSFQMTSSASEALTKAELVFYSGLHLEGKIQKVLEQRALSKKDTYAITDGIPKDKLLKPQDDFDGYHDPHLWGDAELWSECLSVVVGALTKADPDGDKDYQKRAEEYREELIALHTWAKKRMEEVPSEQRVLVTSHDAFFYFGQAYGYEVKGLQGVSTNSEAGLKDRAELIEFIKSRNLKMIFPESSVNSKGIKAVAEEANVAVSDQKLFSDAMGEPGDMAEHAGESYDKGTYIGMMRHNVNTIVEGLK